MKYISTRGSITPINFCDAIMMGLADDGGLLLPESIPQTTMAEVEAWKNLPYQYLAVEILSKYRARVPPNLGAVCPRPAFRALASNCFQDTPYGCQQTSMPCYHKIERP